MKNHDQLYLDYCQNLVSRNFAENTQIAYKKDILGFLDYLESVHLTLGMGVTHRTIEAFIASAQPSPRCLSAVWNFFRYLRKKNIIQRDPMALVDRPRVSKKLPEILSQGEIQSILGSIDTRKNTGLRDKAMIEFLYSTGCRISEVLALRFCDLDLSCGIVKVSGKGDKQRLVYMSNRCMDALLTWIYAHEHSSTSPVFPNRDGQHMTRQTALMRIKKISALAGVTKNVHPHMFRHSFATHMMDSGADLLSIRTILGHQDIKTTEVYLQVSSKRIQDVHRMHHGHHMH